MAPQFSIRWPDRFRPDRAPVHVSNRIDIDAPADRTWSWLIRAVDWPAWYPNSAGVAIEGGGSDLRPQANFRWKTFGIALRSRVEEFEPPQRLAWSARGVGVDVYHAWLISATTGGCHILTEESQYGWLARIGHAFQPHRMERGHQMWLENLRARARSGPPPDSA